MDAEQRNPHPHDRLDALAARRISIGDDGDVVLAADPDRGYLLPLGAGEYHLVPLIAQGYARHERDGLDLVRGYVLTEAGVALRERYAEIRGHTADAARPYGPLTPPSPGEVRDAEPPAHPNAQATAVPLAWPYGRPTR